MKTIINYIIILITCQGLFAQKLNPENAQNIFNQTNYWVDSFTPENIVSLPVGMATSFGQKNEKGKSKTDGLNAAIVLSNARFSETYTEFTAYAKVQLPQTNNQGKPLELIFGSDNLKISKSGGIIGDAKLSLLKDVELPFGNTSKLTILGGINLSTSQFNSDTYVSMDCDGLENLSIHGLFELSRDLVVPVDSNNYQIIANKNVGSEFKMMAENWNDLIVSISLPSFSIATKNPNDNRSKFIFNVQKATLDLSDVKNEIPDYVFPQEYHQKGLLFPNSQSWKGIYVENFELILPPEFKTNKSAQNNKRISFAAKNLFIDHFGVSGDFYAKNLYTIDEGTTSKQNAWKMSLNEININLVVNKIKKIDFNGDILLPIASSENKEKNKINALTYHAIISENQYFLKAGLKENMDFNIFKAKAKLYADSFIELNVIDNEFMPKAVLNGELVISTNIDNKEKQEENSDKNTVQFKGIKFQTLVLQTKAPIISCDYFGYENQNSSLANLPISINKIGLILNQNEASLVLGIDAKLMEEKIKGSTIVKIQGEFENINSYQNWKYKTVKVSDIDISAKFSALELQGKISILENDPIYGKGLAGQIQGKFGMIGPINVSALFAKTQTENPFRYWMVDASVGNLNIKSGTFNIDGFAGGASYKMIRSNNLNSSSNLINPTNIPYIPDEKSGLGVKAMIFFNISSEKLIKGSGGFEMTFNSSNGIKKAGIYGEASILNNESTNYDLNAKLAKIIKNTSIDSNRSLLEKSQTEFPNNLVGGEGSVSAYLGMEMDFENKTFHAELNTFVNIQNVITGRNANNSAGQAVIHIAPDDWYVLFGTPKNRLGLKAGIGSLSVNAGGYFMTGNNLPKAMPVPNEVAEILGTSAQELNYMRSEERLKTGLGFAFGMDFSYDTGDLHFLIVYARFKAGAGFDIMMNNYGDAKCRNTGGNQVGINGWYANGQAYAYLQGEIGVGVKMFGTKFKMPIASAGAAILLQGSGPNPFGFKGYLGGKYNVLGGAIKGKFRLKVTIGEKCEFMTDSPLAGMKIISDLTPKKDSKDIDVFAIPQATFSMKVGESIVIPDEQEDKTYKIILDDFSVTNQNGNKISGTLKWSENKDVVNFISTDILPPNTNLKAKISVSFQQMISGVFTTVQENGKPVKETEERDFITGSAPSVIPLHNVQFAYPVLDQKYFLKKENNQGFIQLKRGQDYLFEDNKWTSSILFEDEKNNRLNEKFNYDNNQNRIYYQIPELKNQNTYNFAIISTSKNPNQIENSAENSSEKIQDENGNEVEFKNKKAVMISKNGEIQRLGYSFSTSKYNKLEDKISSLSTKYYNFSVISSDVIQLLNTIKENEPFDLIDLEGSEYTEFKPLIQPFASLEDEYYKQDIFPVLYKSYPFESKYFIRHRSVNPSEDEFLGVPPIKAIPISSTYIINEKFGINSAYNKQNFPFIYDVSRIYKQDWIDIKNQIANDLANNLIDIKSASSQFLEKEFKFMRLENYLINLKYFIPGKVQTSDQKYIFKNRTGKQN